MALNRILPNALAVLALFASTSVAAQQTSGALFSWSGRVASGATFSVRSYNGPVDVRATSGDRVEFRADRVPGRSGRSGRVEDVSFAVENRADGVMICAVYRERNYCDRDGSGGRRGWDGWDEGPPSVRLTILLPRGVRLDGSTGNGDVTVDQAGNDVKMRTGNGDVRITMTAGRVDVSSGNGVLHIEGATGPVEARTGNGRINVVTSSGPVNASSGNGDVDVYMKTLQNAADMRFTTGNGSVTVSLPGNYSGEIDASTGHGELRSDFEIRVMGRLNPRHIRGTIGEGGTHRIRMSSGNGRITIRRSS